MGRWTWEQPLVPKAELMVDRGASATDQQTGRERARCLQERGRRVLKIVLLELLLSVDRERKNSPFQAEAMAC